MKRSKRIFLIGLIAIFCILTINIGEVLGDKTTGSLIKKNRTGQTVNDFEISIEKGDFIGWKGKSKDGTYHGQKVVKFPKMEVSPDNKKIKFSGADVKPGEWINIWYKYDGGPKKKTWTKDGNPVKKAKGINCRLKQKQGAPQPQPGKRFIELIIRLIELLKEYFLDISEFHLEVDVPASSVEGDTILTGTGREVPVPTSFTISDLDSIIFDLGELSVGDYVLLYGNAVEESTEFAFVMAQLVEPQPVPSMRKWGIVIFVLAIVFVLSFFIMRRRVIRI